MQALFAQPDAIINPLGSRRHYARMTLVRVAQGQYEELLWDSLADAQDATSRQEPIHENDNEPVGFKGSSKKPHECTNAR